MANRIVGIFILVGIFIGLPSAYFYKLTKDTKSEAKEVGAVHLIQDLETTFNTFRQSWYELPGDINKYCESIGGICIGNNDGKINTIDESLLAWRHLSMSRLISGEYTGALDNGKIVPGVNVPKFYLGGGINLYYIENFRNRISSYSGRSSDEFQNRSGHVFIVASVFDGRLVGPIFTPEEAKNIDYKLDDGIPITGGNKNYDGGVSGGVFGYTGEGHTGKPCIKNGKYDLSHNEETCRLMIWATF